MVEDSNLLPEGIPSASVGKAPYLMRFKAGDILFMTDRYADWIIYIISLDTIAEKYVTIVARNKLIEIEVRYDYYILDKSTARLATKMEKVLLCRKI